MAGCWRLLAGLAAALVAAAAAAQPTLTVTAGGRSESWTPGGLLSHPAALALTVERDPAYGRTMTYRAVPIAALLNGVAPTATLRFVAADGAVTTLQLQTLAPAAPGAPRAYLAVEPPDSPWPPLEPGAATSAGPFYLVWSPALRPRPLAQLSPHGIASIEVAAPLAERYPMIVPPPGLAADASVRRGFAVAVRSCLVCHSLNLGGDAAIGPDLNVPYNPTEYLRADALRRLLRDPQALRRWPGTGMPAFSVAELSDRELNDVLAYLRYMANRKVPLPPPAK